MTLSRDERARYERQIVLPEIGATGQLALKAAQVAVVGAGGVGSPALLYLAGAGVGTLVVIDDDRVDASNLQRQILFTAADIGASKSEAAAAALARLNPHVLVEPHRTRIDASNAAHLLAEADVVIDGSDDFATRLAVADAALMLRIPLVSAAVGRFDVQLATFRGWEVTEPCYRCLVGGDPQRAGDETCADVGVLGMVTGVAGSLAALEAVRAVTGFGADTTGRLTLIDLADARYRTVMLPKDPACPACARQPSSAAA